MACLHWEPCCHPPAFLLAEGRLCSVKHAPKACCFSYEDKMGDDKKTFLWKKCCCMCYPWDAQESFPQVWCHWGQVIKVADFSNESGVSVAGSELPLHPPYRREGIELAGEMAQEWCALSSARWSCSGDIPSCPTGKRTSAWWSEQFSLDQQIPNENFTSAVTAQGWKTFGTSSHHLSTLWYEDNSVLILGCCWQIL